MSTAPLRRSLTHRAALAAVAALVAVCALLGVETAYALWQDRAGIESAPVATGTAALTAEWSSQKDAEAWKNLLPGDQVQRDVTMENTGDVPLTLEASTGGTGVEVQLSQSGLVLEPGQETVVAIELTVTTELAPGARSGLEIQIEGRQVA